MQDLRPGRGAAAATDIVVRVPVELKSVVDPMLAVMRSALEHMSAARGGGAVDYAAFEVEMEMRPAAVERATHADVLANLEIDAPRVELGGKEYARVGYGNGAYRTMAGPVQVRRALYRQRGCRNAKVVDAISLRAGTIGDGWLPKTARAMAHLHQQGTSREAVASAKEMGRLPYSRASFERVAHEVGHLYLQHRANIEDQLIRELEIPEAAASVSSALDRTTVPMEEPAKRRPGRPRKDAPKRPITRQFRMAWCGTVTLHDANGEALHTIRYAQMPDRDPMNLCNAMANDVYRLRERCPQLKLSLLADGAPDIWKLIEASMPEDVFGRVHRTLDFWHLMEKLAPAARVVCHGNDVQTKALMRHWRRRLRRRKDAAREILAELVGSGCEHVEVDSSKPVHEAITYLQNHGHRMNYATAIREGLPIGSGNVEASCKTLVAIRMKRSGSRWKSATGDHVLHLRALALSDRWDGAMDKLMATQRTAVRLAA